MRVLYASLFEPRQRRCPARDSRAPRPRAGGLYVGLRALCLLLLLGLTSQRGWAQAPTVKVTPAGPLTLCAGSTQTLTATASVPGFNVQGTGFDGQVQALAVQADGKVLVGGNFSSYNGNGNAPDKVLRLNADGSLDTTFNPRGSGVNSFVYALAVQADGKVLVGGDFTSYNGNAAAPDNVLRLNADGSLDTTFNPGGAGADSNVNALAVQADGKVLIGGVFTYYNGNPAAPDLVLRLNADGSLDTTFNPGGAGADGDVYALAVQADGKVLVGGFFTSYNGNAAAPDYVLRLNTNGSLDNSFNNGGTGTNGGVRALAVQADGKVLVGGQFTAYNGNAAAPDQVLRLNADGSLDTSFNNGGTGSNQPVQAVAVQADGKVLVGGDFTAYNGNAAAPDYVLRLNADGSLDTSFNNGGTGTNSFVQALAVQADGKVLVGGVFTSYNGTPSPRALLRLRADGSLDNGVPAGLTYTWSNGATGPSITVSQPGDYQATATTTSNGTGYSNVVRVNAPPAATAQVTPAGPISLPAGGSATLTATATQPGFNVQGSGFNGNAFAVVVQADGKVLVGGSFTTYNGNAATPDYVLRLNADGSLDNTFNNGGAGANGAVFALAVQADGKVLVGGGFTAYNGNAAAPDGVLRLNADGSLDTSFNNGGSGVDHFVQALAVQADGKVLIGGQFTAYNGNSNAPDDLLRLNADGSLDTSFNNGGAGANSTVGALVVQADGKVLAGGQFTSYNGNAAAPYYVLRLNADGSLDTSFNNGGAGTNSGVNALAVQADGKVLVGGGFTAYNGNAAAPDGVLRLNADGSLDNTFNPGGAGANAIVNALAVQADGKVLIGGSFTAYNGNAAAPDYVVRLNADGSLDNSFNNGQAGASGDVRALAVQADGKVLVGGLFTAYNGNAAAPDQVLRLNADGSLDTSFNTGGTGANNFVLALAVQADGKVLVGGNFTSYNGNAAAPDYVLRLNADGSLDTSFNTGGTGPNSTVNALAVQADGKVLIGGGFTSYNGTPSPRALLRLNADGSLNNAATPLAGATFVFNPGNTPGSTRTVNAAGTYTATATDPATGCTYTSNAVVVTVAPTIAVAPATLPDGTVAAAYSQTLTASGGTAPYAYAVTAGALPAGLTLTPAGVLSGTPTTSGTFSFTVRATDASPAPGPYTGSRAYTVAIANQPITAAPVVTAPANGSFVNTTTPTYSGTAPAGSTVTVYVDGASIGTTSANASGSFSLAQPTALAQGSHAVRATAQASGQAGSASSATNTFTVDTVQPTVTISSTAGASGSSTNTSPIPFRVTFSEAVTGFVQGDLSVSNGTISGFSGSGTTYTFNVTPTTPGTVTTVNVAANVAQDQAGNGNTAATSAYALTYSQSVTTAPVVSTPANGSVLATTTPTYSGTAPAGSTVTVYVDGASLGTTPATSGGSFSLTQPATLAQGAHTVYATAQSSGAAVSANSNTNTFTVDTVAPTVAVSSSAGTSGGTTGTSPIPFTVTFSEAVTGFSAAGVSVTNGTVAGFAGSGTTYTFNVTPTTAGTATTVSVAANQAQDQAGNGNTASTTYALTYSQPVAPAPTAVTVLYENGDGNPTNSSVDPFLQLVNTTTAAIPYQELTVRYYLTVDNFSPLRATIGYAELGTSGVQARYVALPQPAQGALGYIEYSFTSPKSLAAGANSGRILSHISKQNYSAFNEADDYSYGTNTSSYVATDHITVYRNGTLVGGVEPGPMRAAVQLQAQSGNLDTNATTNSLSIVEQVRNLDNAPVAYQDLTLRYWFTPDGTTPLHGTVGYAQLGSSNMSLTLGQAGTQTYAELHFAASLGNLAPLTSSGQIILHVNKQNYANFTQTNDYSFRADNMLVANPHVTVYWQGQLVYGQEPDGAQGAPASAVANALTTDDGPATQLNLTPVLEAYPNPFGEQTALHFRAASSGPARLVVYNSLGQVVQTCLEGPAEAGRDYYFPVSGAALASGVYLARLQVEGRVQTLRLVLNH